MTVLLSPSYKRAKTVTAHKCVPGLKYAVHEFEADEYREQGLDVFELPNSAKGNIARVRNVILNYCDSIQADVIMVDDDVRRISKWEKGRQRVLLPEQVDELIEHGFQLAREVGARMWGINCVQDRSAYREYTPLSFTNVVLGTWCGIMPGTGLRYDERLRLKEDYDLSIQHLNKYRRILRFNAYSYGCDHLTMKGGCSAYRTTTEELEQFDLLRRKWGSKIVRQDNGNNKTTRIKKKKIDTNPIVRVPIRGV